MPKKLFIVFNIDYALLSHRKELVIELKRRGFNITIIAKNTGLKSEIESLGLKFIDLPMSRSSLNPLKGLKTFIFLMVLYKREKPEIIHHVGITMCFYGTFAAKFAHTKRVVNAVNGLGFLFSLENTSLRFKLTSKIVLSLLRFAYCQQYLTIFQNNEDKKFFLDKKIINKTQSFKIKGSGVDLNIFKYHLEESEAKLHILFAARMIKEKGILEVIDAANSLKAKYENKIIFLLCGKLDNNPSAISKVALEKYCDDKYIQWLGDRSDIKALLKKSHIVLLPSYYNEGIPKSLIEACAIGRPIITTDWRGCRDTVINDYNGFLVPIKNSTVLAEKIEILINNKDLRLSMGEHSRQLAEKEFSIERVIDNHIEIYNDLYSITKNIQ